MPSPRPSSWVSRTVAVRTAFLVLGILLWGCGGQDDSEVRSNEPAERGAAGTGAPESAGPAGAVRIVLPGDGSVVEGPEVAVSLEVTGIVILPAGDTTAGSGHHHLYLDEDLTDPTMPVPVIPGRIVHLGDGSSSYVFEGVPPGDHRLIAAVADFAHFPLIPWVVDTVRFTVR
jgi:hypothetical protein